MRVSVLAGGAETDCLRGLQRIATTSYGARSALGHRVCHSVRMWWLVLAFVAALVGGLVVVLARRGASGERIGHNTPGAFRANDNVTHNSGPF